MKEGENVETGVTMVFLTLRKLRPISVYQSILDNSDEAVLRTIVHNDYLTDKQRPTTTAKCANPLVREEVYPHSDWC